MIALLPRTSADGPLFREHEDREGADRGCWWFSCTGTDEEPQGRFDLPAPRGSLYLAESAQVAARERCGRFLAHHRPIPVTFVEGRVVSTVEGSARDIADFTHHDAAECGATREISTIDDYILTTTWSAAADDADFAGVKYSPRFSTGADAAYALFGSAGAHPPEEFTITSVSSLPEVLAREGIGARVIPTTREAVDDEADDVDVR